MEVEAYRVSKVTFLARVNLVFFKAPDECNR